jgi:hypothetical protein
LQKEQEFHANMMFFHNVLLKEQKNKKSQLRNIVHLVVVFLHVNPPHHDEVIENPNDHLHGKPQKGTNNICAIIEREGEKKNQKPHNI